VLVVGSFIQSELFRTYNREARPVTMHSSLSKWQFMHGAPRIETSHLTFLARQDKHAFAALLRTLPELARGFSSAAAARVLRG
jgi:hypothetical protein